MSGGGGGGSKGPAAAVPIPVGARKIVQSLKEIVNCPEAEIYAVLRECDMDPDEAVNRLLAQDTFHEVKSKRDKKKEIKEPSESPRPRAGNYSLSRVSRSATDRGGRSTYSQISSIDYGGSRSKLGSKKENGATVVPTLSMSESFAGRSTVLSSAPVGTTTQAASHADEYSVPSQPSPGFQSNWLGKPGHISMADIVKMGRPQAKPSNLSSMATDWPYMAQSAAITNIPHNSEKQPPLESENKLHYSQEPVSQIPEITHEIGIAEDQLVAHDGWSKVDETPTMSKMQEMSDASCPSGSVLPDKVVGVNFHSNPHVEEIQLLEENFNGTLLSTESKLVSLSGQQTQFENSVDASLNDDLHHSQGHVFEHHEVEDVNVEISTATVNFQQLDLHDETNTRVVESNPAVIIPDHLQVTNADCAQLSFGSFGSGAFSGSFASNSLKSNVESSPITDNASPVDQTNIRTEYYVGEHMKPMPSEGVALITVDTTENIDTPSLSHTEVSRNDTLDSTHGLQYKLPSDSYAFSDTVQSNATTYSYPQGNGQIQNLSPFSNSMQPNTQQSSLLSPNTPSLRDFDIPFTHLLTTQSIPTKYSSAAPSLSGSVSPLEAVKPGVFSNAQSSPQTVGANIPTAPALPQQLAAHLYSQPALPLGHFANMMSYPFLHQSYTYLPSAAYQQAYAGNGPFHQSPAPISGSALKYSLPQYRGNISATSLSQSSALAPAYGDFANSANIPGNFSMDPNAASSTATIAFDEALGLQYKEASQYLPLQQNENATMWANSAGSRTVSSVPASAFYNYQGQSQQAEFRHNQQPSQFGASGYPNFYHSHPGSLAENQQNPNEGNLNRSQTLQSQPAHHIWQHGY